MYKQQINFFYFSCFAKKEAKIILSPQLAPHRSISSFLLEYQGPSLLPQGPRLEIMGTVYGLQQLLTAGKVFP